MSYNVHDRLKDLSVEEIKAVADADRLNFSVCLLNLEHDLNIGNCIRTAHIMGASRVFIFGRRRYDLRSTVGANHYTNIVKIEVDDITDQKEIMTKFFKMTCDYNLFPVLIDKTDSSIDISEYPYYYHKEKNSVDQDCLVFGNEQAGIPDCILDYYDEHYHIPQLGVMRSLNVATAAGIAMYAYTQGKK